jgi:RecB family exonuclease
MQNVPLVQLGQGDFTRTIGPDSVLDRELLTTSRMNCLRRCPREHYLRYELRLRRSAEASYLRLGSAYHRGIELISQGMEPAEAIADAISGYAHCPPSIEADKWAVERETVTALIAGHAWRYGNDELEIIEVEKPFEIPLRNPKTGAASRTFLLAGKIDAIGRLPDGRYVVVEYKTTGDDIAPGAMYWLRLRHDPQISLYVIAARELGYDVAGVFYDACRKPTIRLKKTETPEEYGQRLWEDITSVRPDYYYQRHEIPRLEDELEAFSIDAWDQAKQLMDVRRHKRWFRNASRWTCDFCDYAGICLSGQRIDPNAPPSGFRVAETAHPELAE